MQYLISALLISLVALLIVIWITFFIRGRQFARRDRLRHADTIIVLAGTRGNIRFLDGKIETAVRLYRQGWAPSILCCGMFSAKVTDTPTLIPLETLQKAVAEGRIQEKDLPIAATTWDSGLGACYLRDKALAMGVKPEALLIENQSLHTRENAEFVLALLKGHGFRRVILVTSPFHQLRTYLTFAKVFQPHQIEIINDAIPSVVYRQL